MKRIGLICLSILITLGVMGVGYAYWTQTIDTTANVQMATMDWIFTDCFVKDQGIDWTCDPGTFDNIRQLQYDIGSTTAVVRKADNHYIDCTMANIYPGYYTALNAQLKNVGTLPIQIQSVTLYYGGQSYALTDDGTVVTTNDGVFQFEWIGDTVNRIPQGNRQWIENFDILALNPVYSTPTHTQTYPFSITINGVQTNQTP